MGTGEGGHIRKAAPVGALHGVEDERGFLRASGRLSSRVGAEPIVGEDCVRCPMIQTVLVEVDLYACHL